MRQGPKKKPVREGLDAENGTEIANLTVPGESLRKSDVHPTATPRPALRRECPDVPRGVRDARRSRGAFLAAHGKLPGAPEPAGGSAETARIRPDFGDFDRSLSDAAAGGGAARLQRLPAHRAVSPGSVAIFCDVGRGQGWQRSIPVDGSPHLPGHVQQRFGDSRGRREGDTLVVYVAKLLPEARLAGLPREPASGAARGRLVRVGIRVVKCLVERRSWLDATTLEYIVTIKDRTFVRGIRDRRRGRRGRGRHPAGAGAVGGGMIAGGAAGGWR